MRTHSTADYIYQLIAQGEHDQQDFKYEISDIPKIARSLSAFANTRGGRLLIGVKDNGKIAGVQSDEEMYMVQAAADLYCEPPVTCEMTSYLVEGRTVVIATIEPADKVPVRARLEDNRYCAFVRIADENIVASPVQMMLWREQSNETGSLLPFTEREESILQLFSTNASLSLNQFCRAAKLPRHKAIRLLAQFIRFGLVEQLFEGHRFLYRGMENA